MPAICYVLLRNHPVCILYLILHDRFGHLNLLLGGIFLFVLILEDLLLQHHEHSGSPQNFTQSHEIIGKTKKINENYKKSIAFSQKYIVFLPKMLLHFAKSALHFCQKLHCTFATSALHFYQTAMHFWQKVHCTLVVFYYTFTKLQMQFCKVQCFFSETAMHMSKVQ